jgi:hypothetical protein
LYKEKLLNTPVKTENAARLQSLLLDYHLFRYQEDTQIASKARLTKWQTHRLQTTHHDFYQSDNYREGLIFLLEELYSPTSFTQRDDDIDRIFPKMVKLLPDAVLATVSDLIELNLLTQRLDGVLAHRLFNTLKVNQITHEHYAKAYRDCDNYSDRLYQITLTQRIGQDIDGLVRSKWLLFILKITGSAAEMAGLGQLHQFLRKGFEAFHLMGGVDELLNQIVDRETCILNQIYNNMPEPLSLPSHFYHDE